MCVSSDSTDYLKSKSLADYCFTNRKGNVFCLCLCLWVKWLIFCNFWSRTQNRAFIHMRGRADGPFS